MQRDASRKTRKLETLRILHVTAPARVGGLESVVRALSAGHRSRGHSVMVAAVISDGGACHPFIETLAESGVSSTAIELPARAYSRERSAIDQLCQSFQPDVVHTHGYRSDVVDAGVARRRGIPVISTVHGFTGDGWRGRLYEWAQLQSYRGFDAVVAVSRRQVSEIAHAGVASERIHVIRNAWFPRSTALERVSARQLLGVPDNAIHIGWVGRVSREKGPDIFVDAMLRLADLPLYVSIIGDGPDRDALLRKTNSAGAGNRFRWHGTMTDASSVFKAFDVFVLSSRTEGTPIVLFEAMAAGVPVVASRVGGVPDVVSECEAALVPAGDPDALAAAVKNVCADPSASRARANAAQQRLEIEFSSEPWLQAYEDVYRQVVMRASAKRLSA